MSHHVTRYYVLKVITSRQLLAFRENPILDICWRLLKQKAIWTVAFLGGSCNNGLNAGLFNWNVNNVSSNSNWNIGSQVVCYKSTFMSKFERCDLTYGC